MPQENAQLPTWQEVADYLAPEGADVPDPCPQSRDAKEYPVFYSDGRVGPDCDHETMVRASRDSKG